MTSRLKAAWYVLTGRPVMFRMKVRDGVLSYDATRGARVLDCDLHNMHIKQAGGSLPSADGVKCGVHRLQTREDDAGNLVCPMDGAVVLAVNVPPPS